MRHSIGMLASVIPKTKIKACCYVFVATTVVVMQLFSLDKSIELDAAKDVYIWMPLILLASFVTVLSLPFAIGLETSTGLRRLSRLCVVLAPLFWLCVVVLALINGIGVGMFGVYLVKPSLVILPILAYFAYILVFNGKIGGAKIRS